jgi:hypothetical protein
VAVSSRNPLLSWKANLPSVLPDDEGRLRPTKRDTTVTLYAVEQGETPMLYEMGIPVVEFESLYHVSIGQKVPLNFDRDNVNPAYRAAVLVEVLNHTADRLTADNVREAWVTVAASDERASKEAVTTVLDKRYGENRFSYDPNDPEANKIAISKGATIVHGSSMPSGMWKNAREAGAIAPPPPSPHAAFGNNGKGPIPYDKWTDGMKSYEKFAVHFGEIVLGKHVNVSFYTDDCDQGWQACYGKTGLSVAKKNIGGNPYFDGGVEAHLEQWVELLIHEYSHDAVSDHLSNKFHEECCRLGAKYIGYLSKK